MCHCKTCADRLHVIVAIIAIAIPYSLASCLIKFPFLHIRIPFTSRRFYALSIVHDTSSKNAHVSPATTSFPWRQPYTNKNHGYNAVADDAIADDSGQVSSAKRHFRDVPLTPARITDITLSRMTLSRMTLGKCLLLNVISVTSH